MPSGHTDTATINQRRPVLTELQIDVLRSVERRQRSLAGYTGYLCTAELARYERSPARSLRQRGLIQCDVNGFLTLTDAGREALAATPK